MTTLTQCQQQVLDMLISYQKERGFPPTNQEVATMLGYQTGRLARSIGYMVPRASKHRPGFMARIAPNQRNGEGNRRITGDFYPAFLFYGVRRGAKRRRSHHRGASGGSGWRLAPRNNFMVETLEKNRSWTRYFLARELRKSLKPERRRR
ncbi:lexA DNA binding domain protein [Escherichia coli 7-233-03_S3_C3]|uniref:LexA family protein n=1 Tax=Escherichia coli TaxID=562 RepID=UPI0004D84AD6|nr:hypothetical protein [Escherichia coli]KEN09245.1 lexA DNA binding domain protein [Escherichia coli 7-233-03_S3_C3]